MRNGMPGKATMEHVRAKRRAYAVLKTKKAKSAAINELCARLPPCVAILAR